MHSIALAFGTRIQAATTGRWGTVVGLDADHYHARVNSRTVYQVRWDGGGVGSGWTRDDLIAI